MIKFSNNYVKEKRRLFKNTWKWGILQQMAPSLQLGEDGNAPWQPKWSLVMAPPRKTSLGLKGLLKVFVYPLSRCFCLVHSLPGVVFEKEFCGSGVVCRVSAALYLRAVEIGAEI